MLRFWLILLLMLCVSSITYADWRKHGERITFDVSFSLISIGQAELAYSPKKNGTYQIIGRAWTHPSVTSLMQLADRINIEGSHHTAPFETHTFNVNLNENEYRARKKTVFQHTSNQALYTNIKDNTPATIHPLISGSRDLFSALYSLRNVSKTPKVGDYFQLPVFDLERQYEMTLHIRAKERVKTKDGTFNTLKIQPILTGIRADKEKDKLHIWVTDDGLYTPVKFEIDARIGSFKAILIQKDVYDSPSLAPTYLKEFNDVAMPTHKMINLLDDFIN